MHTNAALFACAAAALAATTTNAFVTNASFETDSGWSLENDAELAFSGGAAGWTWDSPVVPGQFITASEDVFATDGQNFAITYAGSDEISQLIEIAVAGTYLVEVDVNGIAGTNTFVNGNSVFLNDGSYELFIGAQASDVQVASRAGGWTTFSWEVDLSAGNFNAGIRNVGSSPYAIAYDNFRLVPTPSAATLAGLAGLAALRRRR